MIDAKRIFDQLVSSSAVGGLAGELALAPGLAHEIQQSVRGADRAAA